MCQTSHKHEEGHHHHEGGRHQNACHEGRHSHNGHHHGHHNGSCFRDTHPTNCTSAQSCCNEPHIHRRFTSKEERIAKLEAYKQELANELAGIKQEIRKIQES